MTMKYVLCLVVLAVSLSNVRAHISAETQMAIMNYSRGFLDECLKELNMNMDDVKNKFTPTGDLDDSVKCLFACSLKKKGMLNEEGKIDLEKSLEILTDTVKNYEDYKILESIAKSCASVNDEKVTDGVKGCERTGLLFACITKQVEKMNLK